MKKRLGFEESRKAVYNHEIFKKDMSVGMTLSWPVLRKENNGTVIAFFLYPNMPVINRSEGVNTPSAWLCINEVNSRLMLFSRCDIFSFTEDEKLLKLNKVEGYKAVLNIEEMKALKATMAENYDLIKDYVFTDKNSLNQDIKEAKLLYLEAFNKLTPEGHKPFYSDLGRDFFMWLEE
jgi:hypothetical protein